MSQTIKLVTNSQVNGAIEGWLQWAALSTLPTHCKEEWDKDHTPFFVGRVLPILDLPIHVRRIATEAYLSGYEFHSDGSSVVPESHRYGNTKDWQGVMHDYIFYLHSKKCVDAFGHTWTLLEANNAYRIGWVCDGQIIRGNLWWVGLSIGSPFVWYTKGNVGNKPT